jgi:hypothetical protein
VKFRSSQLIKGCIALVSVTVFLPACSGSAGGGGGNGGSAGDSSDGGGGGNSGGGSTGGTNAVASANCETPDVLTPGPAPLVRLSATEYRNTLRDLFPKVAMASVDLTIPAEVQSEGFLNTAESQAPSPNVIEAFSTNAQSVAKLAVADLSKILPCTAANAAEEATCGPKFIAAFGKQAFRRPLSAEETTRFTAFFKDASTKWGFPVAVRMMTEAFLQSPTFLYRLETAGKTVSGTKAIALDNYEVASRLSYLLTDSMPDADLMSAADAGKLASVDGLEEQARRLLKTDQARQAVASFHAQWLRFEKLDKLTKAADLYPAFNAAMAANLKDATTRYVDRIFWDEGHTVQSLLTDNHAYVNKTLAPLYGATSSSTDLVWSEVNASQRSGILTQAGFMAGLAHERNDAPVLRGIFVLDRLLCQPPPAPPGTVNTNLPPLTSASKQTTRQQLEASHSTPTCASCHKSIDGIGFGFGNFDALGQWRTKEFGIDVDASGEFVSTDDLDGKFNGAADMGKKMAASAQVRACVAAQWLGYALAVRRDDLDACMVSPLVKALDSAKDDLRELVVALVKSDAFRHRPVTQ